MGSRLGAWVEAASAASAMALSFARAHSKSIPLVAFSSEPVLAAKVLGDSGSWSISRASSFGEISLT